MTPASSSAQGTITRADIEAKLAEIRGVTDTTTEVAQEATKPILVILGIGLVIGAFLLGRRRGSKRSTIVEVRRV
jgi:LPXTG-motif cell wall-anchored protein